MPLSRRAGALCWVVHPVGDPAEAGRTAARLEGPDLARATYPQRAAHWGLREWLAESNRPAVRASNRAAGSTGKSNETR